MSGYLDRLLTRAQSAPAPVRPQAVLLRSRFAPASPPGPALSDALFELAADVAPSAAQGPVPVTVRASRPVVSRPAASSPADSSANLPPPIARADAGVLTFAPLPPAHDVNRGMRPDMSARSREALRTMTPDIVRPDDGPTRPREHTRAAAIIEPGETKSLPMPAAASPPIEAHREADPRVAVRTTIARRRDEASAERIASAAQTGSTGLRAAPVEVHVTIGRIEITAARPAPVRAARRSGEPVGPAMSLDDYLARRGSGRP